MVNDAKEGGSGRIRSVKNLKSCSMGCKVRTYVVEETNTSLDIDGLRCKCRVGVQRERNLNLGLVRHPRDGSASNFEVAR